MNPPLDQLTSDGYDLQWGTNVLGHFYLTELLLPALDAGARSSPDGRARIVTTSSGGAYLGKLQYETMRDGAARRKKTTEDLYFQSKLVRTVTDFSLSQCRRCPDSSVGKCGRRAPDGKALREQKHYLHLC